MELRNPGKFFGSLLNRKHEYFSDKAFIEDCEPTTVNDDNIEEVEELVFENSRFGIKEMAQVLNINNSPQESSIRSAWKIALTIDMLALTQKDLF
ncbi:unnamed protein product [Hermetia illucens]|uniref:Uncharacterized protein n=1 Tax=Hermetia illucens TaxID=343691 RepID=A0A7R8UPK0_HERIL|nr:unnamed protein product [Hermetia illucens]